MCERMAKLDEEIRTELCIEKINNKVVKSNINYKRMFMIYIIFRKF